MNKILQGIIIIILALAVSFLHPLNAKLKDAYVVTPIDAIVKLEDVKAVYTNKYIFCLECIYNLIDITNKEGYTKANNKMNEYLKNGEAAMVYSGFVPVIYLETYNGFWIFKLDR